MAVKLGKAFLKSWYREMLPGASPVIRQYHANRHEIRYDISWYDRLGEEAAHRSRILHQHDDGSLELYAGKGWVHPAWRGLGHSARMLREEIRLLQQLSDHPQTRIVLKAGGTYVAASRSFERSGAYVWAKFGYDFAENYPELPPARDRRQSGDLDRTRTAFLRWLKGPSGILGVDERLIQDDIARWHHPWEVAAYRISGQEAGKTFLGSPDAPAWRGVFFVNQPDFPGKAIQESYCREQEEKAGNARQRRLNLAFSRLEQAQDPAEAEEAFREIERLGDSTMMEKLSCLAGRKPALAKRVHDATALLTNQSGWRKWWNLILGTVLLL